MIHLIILEENSDSSEDEHERPDTPLLRSERSNSPLSGEAAEEQDDDIIVIRLSSQSPRLG